MEGGINLSINLDKMVTESRNERTMHLDEMNTLEVVTVMNEEDRTIPDAISLHLNEIATVAQWASDSMQNNGHVYYMGAGTSGRLGVLDSVECPPTFGVDYDLVVGLIAGGPNAFVKAKEGAEDSKDLGRQALIEHNLSKDDLVIGLAASGRTPYVIGGLEYANEIGCKTASISCNTNSEIGNVANLAIDVIVGPEVLTGSTRLKAGTAQKMILNMISTAAMVNCGKAYQNLMVDVKQNNEKLCSRALNIVMAATDADRDTAKQKLKEANGSCKKAIVMILAECDSIQADELLAKAKGHVRKAIEKGV